MRSRHAVPALLLLTPSLLAQIPHPECTAGRERSPRRLSAATSQVARLLPAASRSQTRAARKAAQYAPDSIDALIFADLEANHIAPAPATTDWEFIRRVTLDLTGRVPRPERVLAFVADSSPDKRIRLIDELLAAPEWVDKWTMYFGDLYQNTANRPSIGVNRSASGRNAFYQWIKDSLAANKPYNRMAFELLSSSAEHNFDNGPVNWLIGGVVTGNVPMQDTVDQMTANAFQTFLGISHVDCLLCHNGRGHLDSLSLWGSRTTRYQGWQLASFFSHTQAQALGGGAWGLRDNMPGFTADYALDTLNGNRPARQPLAACAADPCVVAPVYIFDDAAAAPGGNYREALARSLTADFQFARATVNYIWEQMFGRGIVDPSDAFDPARLDPDNPPPDPWTLQPSNPRLLNALARRFVDGGYNLRALMREIAASDTYQLSSRYEGEWNPTWEPFFARKFVRRLWAEELHDAIVQSSGTLPQYSGTFNGSVSYAMQLPDTVGLPQSDGDANNFLNALLRGNRDDQPRRAEGSIVQALSQMNSPFVENRLQPWVSKLIAENEDKSGQDLVNLLFLTVLSRYATPQEMSRVTPLPESGTPRWEAVQDLVWTLYNKVDFIFNY